MRYRIIYTVTMRHTEVVYANFKEEAIERVKARVKAEHGVMRNIKAWRIKEDANEDMRNEMPGGENNAQS